MTNILTKDEIATMKICGHKLAESLDIVIKSARIGIKTIELDKIAEDELEKRQLTPSFKGYEVGGLVYPATLCISINDEIVHGIPGERLIEDGDIISLDIGASLEGIYTDMAISVVIGNSTKEKATLLETTKKALFAGIKTANKGSQIGDIGNAIEEIAKKEGLGIVRDFVGHGIGRRPHLSPQIPNFGQKGTGSTIEEGMALCIEPMLTLGNFNVCIDDDGWTVRTYDGSLSAHFEHTIIIENSKPTIVTR